MSVALVVPICACNHFTVFVVHGVGYYLRRLRWSRNKQRFCEVSGISRRFQAASVMAQSGQLNRQFHCIYCNRTASYFIERWPHTTKRTNRLQGRFAAWWIRPCRVGTFLYSHEFFGQA